MAKKRKREPQDHLGQQQPKAAKAGGSEAGAAPISQKAKKPKVPGPPGNEKRPAAPSPKLVKIGDQAKKKKKKKTKKQRQETGSESRPSPAQGGVSKQASPFKGGRGGSGGHGPGAGSASASKGATGGLSALQAKFKQKLEGGQFRMINEMLYTNTGSTALDSFKKEPELFDVYHKGFREQVSKWPRNPLDDIIAWVRKRPQVCVADLGCGEARLAASVPNKVHSFDLVARNARIQACDIAKVPLPSASVDVVVFCLSLMGTNMMDFIREARRLLVDNGIIKIAEVRSRFEGQEGGIDSFKQACEALGLRCKQLDRSNKMFFMMEFVKVQGGAKAAPSGDDDDEEDEDGEGEETGTKAAGLQQAAGGGGKQRKQNNKGRQGGQKGNQKPKQQKRPGGDEAVTSTQMPAFSAKACLYKRR